jgi:hypothetical protein
MSQKDQILTALQSGRRLTAIDALSEFGCFRLAARIGELIGEGYKIIPRMIKSANGKQFAEYRMEE